MGEEKCEGYGDQNDGETEHTAATYHVIGKGGSIARMRGTCKMTKQNDEKKPEGSVELPLDDLGSVSGGAGGGYRDPAFQRGDCVIIPGVNRRGSGGGRVPRRFIVYQISVVGDTYEYTLLDDKDPTFQMTGVREDSMRRWAM